MVQIKKIIIMNKTFKIINRNNNNIFFNNNYF